MSILIIIRGPLGIGKTTIAKLVAKKIKGKYYAIDEVLTEHGLDVIPENEPCIPIKNFLKVNNIIFPFIKGNLENGFSVIIDGNFYHKIILEHLLEELKGFDSFIFTLKASVERCIQRDSKRKNPHGKEATIATYDIVSEFDYGVIIDNENINIEEKVNEIISFL